MDRGARGGGADAEDPVVREIPVRLSKVLAQKLYLLQYPLRSRARPYVADLENKRARIKVEQSRLQVRFSLDSESANYGGSSSNPSGQLRDLCLESSVVRHKCNYAAGVISQGELILAPVHSVLRMRPSLGHLDDAERKKRQGEEEEKRKQAGVVKSESESRQVTKQFARKAWIPANRGRTRLSYAKQFELREREPWNELRVDGKDTEASRTERARLVSATARGRDDAASASTFSLPSEFYLDRVMKAKAHAPRDASAQLGLPKPATQGEESLSRQGESADAKTPAETEQERLQTCVARLFKTARIVTLKEVCAKLGVRSAEGVRIVLEHLSRFGYLVQGNFVVRGGAIMAQGRKALAWTYLLGQFSRRRTVRRADVARVMRLSYEQTSELLNALAVRRVPTEDDSAAGAVGEPVWEFRKPTDNAFLARYPEIARDHQRRLSEMEQKHLRMLQAQ